MSTVEQLPATVDLEFVRGDTFSRRLYFSSDGSAFDIGDWTITAQHRESKNSATAVDFTIALFTDGSDGLVDISLTAAHTADLPLVGVWDLQRDDGGGVLTMLSGKVTCVRDVTRG